MTAMMAETNEIEPLALIPTAAIRSATVVAETSPSVMARWKPVTAAYCSCRRW